MKKLVFIFLLALGFAGNSHAQTWTWVQDSPLVFCNQGNPTTCGPNNYNGNIMPTVAGSVWIVAVQTLNNVTISNVTGPSGTTWVHCPNCHATSPVGGRYNIDAWYALNGPAGMTTGMTITMSGSPGFFSGQFIELLPPPGTTASYDTSGIATPTSCSGTSGTPCTAASLPGVSATDAIVQSDGGNAAATWNGWSSPYIVDANGYGICLNCTSGTAPQVTYFPCGPQGSPTTCNPEFFGLAFKSSAGTFTPPTPQFSILQYTAPNTANRYLAPPNGPIITCNPSCSLPLPQATTGSGHLLYLASANGGPHITNVGCSPISCASGWVIPVNCQQSASANGSNYGLSCAYNLSIPAGVTSLNITMSGNNGTGFAAFEASSSTGGFAFDQQNNFTSPSGTEFITAPTMSNITNDFIVQLFLNSGGSLGSRYYPQPYNISSFNYFFGANASIAVQPNSGPSPQPVLWINCCWTIANSNTFGSGIAFKTSGTAVAPPTGLKAVVH